MIIDLESPFKEIWKKGYLRTGKDGRKRVDLVSWPDRTTISYARYLLSVKIGRMLTDDEEADHINNDCTDDSLENLQVLLVVDHKLKTKSFAKGRNFVECVCSFCNRSFQRELRNIRNKNTFCSRSCNAKYNKKNNNWGIKGTVDEETVNKIAKLREDGLSDYKISDILKIERSKVWRIRKDNGIS